MLPAIFVIVVCVVIAFFIGLKLSSRYGNKGRYVLLTVSFVLGLIYVFILRDSSFQILLIKSPNTIFYGKWLPIITGFAVGVFIRLPKIKMWRRVILISALLATSSIDLLSYYIYPRPQCGDVTADRYQPHDGGMHTPGEFIPTENPDAQEG